MFWTQAVPIVALAYLFGSFPTGYLVGKLKGVDVRQHGSGNIGATNVLRVIGKPWGIAVFVVDALKGFLAVRSAFLILATDTTGAPHAEVFAVIAAAMAVIGHSFPVWLGFRGGKGVATSAGSIFGLMPIAAGAILLVWLAVFLTTRYVSLASIVGAIALPCAIAILIQLKIAQGFVLLYFSIAIAALVVWRHRSNIGRLLNGSEPRFTRR